MRGWAKRSAFYVVNVRGVRRRPNARLLGDNSPVRDDD